VAISQSATFNTNGNSESFTDLTGTGTFATGTNSSETFTLGAANFSGSITGSGKLVTTGGTLILSGSNSYSGGTTLSGVTIGAGSGTALGSAAVTVSGNSDLYATGTFQTLTNPISIASGKSLTIINDPTTAQDLSLNGNITGSGSLVMSGSANLTLNGTSTYSGGTTINGGQVLFDNNNAFGSGSITFNSGAITGVANVTLQNNFSSSNAITFQAAVETTLTVNPTNATFGSLNFGSSSDTGIVNFEPASFEYFGGQVNVIGGTLLDAADALSQILSAYNVSISSGATFNINGFSTTIKDLTGAGTLATGSNSSETFTLTAANFSGNITGSGKLITTGGTVILSGSNSYSGGTTLGGGLLSAGNNAALGSQTVTVTGSTKISADVAARTLANPISINTGQTLTVVNDPAGSHPLSLNGNITGSGAVVMSGTSTLALNGTNSFSGGTTLNSGQIIVDNNASLGSGVLTLNTGTLTATSTMTLPNAFSDLSAASVTILAATGTTLTLSGTSTLGPANILTFGSTADAGTIDYDSPGGFTLGGTINDQINVNGGTLVDTSGVLSQEIPNEQFPVFIAQSATLNLNGNSTTISNLTGAGTLATGSNSSETLTLQAANFSGSITGSGKLVVAGGTVILSGSNSYSGGTTFNGGLIGAGNGSALGSAAVTVGASSDLYAAGANESLSNSFSLSSGQSLTIVDDPNGAHNLTLSGIISGSGSLVMSGSGNLTLDGSNSFSGGTTINGGQILFNNSSAFGTAAITFNNGTLTATTTASLHDNFSNTNGSAITFQAATGSTLTVNSANSSFSGLNFGSSSDAGTVNFEPTCNAFGGQINVNGGTLLDGADVVSQILSGYNLFIASSAAVNLNGFSPTIPNLTGAGTLATGTNSSETFTLKAANFSGNIAGSGKLVAAGGTVTLSGSNTYSGGTAINSGVLVLAAAGALPTGGKVANNSTLDVNASNTAGQITGTGALVVGAGSAPATLILAGTNVVSTQSTLTINGTGADAAALDLGDNALVISGGGSPSTAESAIQQYTESGAIVSTYAAANGLLVAYADGNDGVVTGLPPGQIVIEPALAGDTDLNGTVNIHDLQNLLSDFNAPGFWDQGNFNGHSTVDISDLQALLTNFNTSTTLAYSELAGIENLVGQFGDTAISNANGTGFTLVSVPEPGSVVLMLAVGTLMARRRRRA
jgi:fibronectin-binding autotransporter adhesin